MSPTVPSSYELTQFVMIISIFCWIESHRLRNHHLLLWNIFLAKQPSFCRSISPFHIWIFNFGTIFVLKSLFVVVKSTFLVVKSLFFSQVFLVKSPCVAAGASHWLPRKSPRKSPGVSPAGTAFCRADSKSPRESWGRSAFSWGEIYGWWG